VYLTGNGLDHRSGEPVVPLLDADLVDSLIAERLERRRAPALLRSFTTTLAMEIQRMATPDPADPRAAGWTYMVAADDLRRAQIADALRPLADHRGMADPASPLVFPGSSADWQTWLDVHHTFQQRRPLYVLIVGGPDLVPFDVQAFMDVSSAVGRVAFADLGDLRAYVHKLLRLEAGDASKHERTGVIFAPDAGHPDPTYFSRHQMAEPIARILEHELNARATRLFGDQASKDAVLSSGSSRPALLYCASHGAVAIGDTDAEQRRVTGALCCQGFRGNGDARALLTGADVPMSEPFFDGAVAVLFACCGYGTPAVSDFHHWIKDQAPERMAHSDLMAALPERLLAHPAGPVAVVAHLDLAWMHGFTDPDDLRLGAVWSPRLVPFLTAVERLLRGLPVALAMARLNERVHESDERIAELIDELYSGRTTSTPEFRAKLGRTFVFRSDARNYMVLGDPAARVSM